MRRQLAAILAADVVGYARMIEADETGVIERLKADRRALIDPCIARHHGEIVRLAGDGALVRFDSILEAARCAIAIQRGMDERNAPRSEAARIRFRMGLNLGDIVVEDDNLHGEGINVAARLESLAQPGGIYLTERVAELVEGRIDAHVEFVETRRVKNVERPVRVFRIALDERSGTAPAAPAAGAPPGVIDAFIGRTHEVRQLESMLDDAMQGHGFVTLLAGPAGVGKTRLTDEVARLAEQRGMTVHRGQCREDSGTPAYWPWRQILRELLARPGAPPPPGAEELATLVPEVFPAGRSRRGSRFDPVDPTASRFRLSLAASALLQEAARQRPRLLVLDDLHRADAPSLGLLEFVAGELAASPVLLIGTYRDTDVPAGHRFQETLSELSRLRRYQTLALGNLERATVIELVGRALGEAAPTLAEEVFRRTGGHPLYLVEVLRHLRQGGARNVLPASLRAIIGQRLGRLTAQSLDVLKAASVIGRNFDLATLGQLVDCDVDTLLAQLDPALQGHQLGALPSPGRYQFSHVLVREVLYDLLSAGERLHRHRTLAEVLEGGGADVAQVAYHYHQAAPLGVAEKATEYSRRAAEDANRLLAYEEAARFFHLALQTATEADRPALTLELGTAQLHAGDSEEASRTFTAAAELAERHRDLATFTGAAIGIEEANFRPGGSGVEAIPVLERAIAWLGDTEPALRLRLTCSLARASGMVGDLARTWRLSDEAGAIARSLGDRASLARATLPGMYAVINDPERAVDGLRLAVAGIEHSRDCGDRLLQLDVSIYATNMAIVAGDRLMLDEVSAERRRLAQALKQPFYQYYGLNLDAALALAEGRLLDSESRANEALAHCRWLSGIDGDGVHGIEMFNVRREQGRLRELAPLVELFVRATPEAATWGPGLALIYVELGEREKARALFDRLGRNGFAALPRDSLWVMCMAYLAEVCAFLGDREAAALLYRQLARYRGCNVAVQPLVCLGAVDRYLGLLATVSAQWERAEAHFRDALALDEAQRFSLWAAHTRVAYAEMLVARRRGDDRARAEALLDEAAVIAQRDQLGRLLARIEPLARRVRSGPGSTAFAAGLSRREVQVLRLVAAGKDNRGIADALFISSNTVAAHMRSILGKTGTANRTEAAAFASRAGLLGDEAGGEPAK